MNDDKNKLFPYTIGVLVSVLPNPDGYTRASAETMGREPKLRTSICESRSQKTAIAFALTGCAV